MRPAERHDDLAGTTPSRADLNLHRVERTGRNGRWIGALPGLVALVLALLPLALVASSASAATPLNVFVGYMDTHTSGSSVKQPSPWPYTDPSSFVGSPCPNYPSDTTCWDASAVRLDTPGSTDITGVHPSVVIGSSTYALWGSNLTVKAHGTLVLTETGIQNSTNFDGSDYSPNAYNGGLLASCVNSGAIPAVQIVIAGASTQYLDSGQVLNGAGVDSGHCLNGSFVSGRMDESHPWVQIGSGVATVPAAPQSLAATAGSASVSLSWSAPVSDGGAAITGYNVYRGTTSGGESGTPVATNVSALSFTDTGLTNGTTYYYQVAALNSAGLSPQSSQAFATPQIVQATAPGAPTSVLAKAGSAQAVVSWTSPASDGGSPVTGYTVTAAPGGKTATTTRATTVSVTGLTNAISYTFTVTATNVIGTSPASAASTAVTPTAAMAGFTGRAPTRVLDTRVGVGAPQAKLGARASLTLTIPGLPAGTTAVAINVTATNPTASSYLSIYPGGGPRPLASSLNFATGQSIANMVLVLVGPLGTVTFYNAAGTVNVIADLVGSFR